MGTVETLKERSKAVLGDWLPPLTPGVGVHAATWPMPVEAHQCFGHAQLVANYLRALVGLDVALRRSADAPRGGVFSRS